MIGCSISWNYRQRLDCHSVDFVVGNFEIEKDGYYKNLDMVEGKLMFS